MYICILLGACPGRGVLNTKAGVVVFRCRLAVRSQPEMLRGSSRTDRRLCIRPGAHLPRATVRVSPHTDCRRYSGQPAVLLGGREQLQPGGQGWLAGRPWGRDGAGGPGLQRKDVASSWL